MRAGAVLLALCFCLSVGLGAQTEGEQRPATFDVESDLARTALGMQADWRDWGSAVSSRDFDRAEEALLSLNSRLSALHLESAPEFAAAAAFLSSGYARSGELEQARYALDAAQALAPDDADVAFVEARLLRLEGTALRGAVCYLTGLGRVLRDEGSLTLSFANILLAAVFLLYVLLGLFGVLQLASKGLEIIGGVGARFAEIPAVGRLLLALLVLLWPLVLPGGFFWISAYWCVLFWKRMETSERAVAASLLLLVAVSPLVIDFAERMARGRLFGGEEVLEAVEKAELRSSLPQDLEFLMRSSPSSKALFQLTGEVHASFGQPGLARQHFDRVLEQDPSNPGALLGLGNFAFGQGNFAGAIDYYSRALEAGAPRAFANFNLSQAYSAIYAFDQAEKSLERARIANDDLVSEWIQSQDVDRIVPVALALESRDDLLATSAREPVDRPRVFPVALHASLSFFLVVAAGVGLGAWLGFASRPRARVRGWFQFASPGLRAAQDGEGVGTLAATLPLALMAALLSPMVQYWALPVSHGPGMAWRFAAAAGILLLWLLARLRWVL